MLGVFRQESRILFYKEEEEKYCGNTLDLSRLDLLLYFSFCFHYMRAVT